VPELLAGFYRVLTSNVCVDARRSDVCSGDSGGPLVVSRGGVLHLAGLTSWGAGCKSIYPAVYVRVGAPQILNWLNLYIHR